MLKLKRKPTNGIIGVDITSTSVKVLELTKQNGRYWVENYASVELPEGSVVEKNIVNTDAVGEALEKAIEKADTRTVNAATAIPNSLVINKVIEMDAEMTDDEREVQIRMEAEQYIPFSLDEANLDFAVLDEPARTAGKVNVALVATRTENVDTRVEVLSAAGLTPKVVDTEGYALERALATIANTFAVGVNVLGVLDIGHSTTTFSVLQNGKVIYTREQSFGGKVLTQAIQNHYGIDFKEANEAKIEGRLPDDYEADVLEPFLDQVEQQASRALQFFQSSSTVGEIDHLLLIGGSANLPGLARKLQGNLGYRTTVANPFVQMSFANHIDTKKIENDAAGLLTVCGLALRGFD